MRPQARLVLLVWRPYHVNRWVQAIDAALGDAAPPTAPGADPFSLGDATATAGLLDTAGFDDIHLEDVHEPVLYGHDLDAALAVIQGFESTRAALGRLNPDQAAQTVARLRDMLAAHYTDEGGVRLDARSWLVTARRRLRPTASPRRGSRAG